MARRDASVLHENCAITLFLKQLAIGLFQIL